MNVAALTFDAFFDAIVKTVVWSSFKIADEEEKKKNRDAATKRFTNSKRTRKTKNERKKNLINAT